MARAIKKVSHRWILLWGASVTLGLLLAGCTSDAAEVERGRAIYVQNCQSCHGDAATGDSAVAGAPIHGPSGHTWHHANGQLVDIVLGRLSYLARTMPSYEATLSKKDVLAILAYLKTGWLPQQRAFQEEASRNWEKLQKGR